MARCAICRGMGARIGMLTGEDRTRKKKDKTGQRVSGASFTSVAAAGCQTGELWG